MVLHEHGADHLLCLPPTFSEVVVVARVDVEPKHADGQKRPERYCPDRQHKLQKQRWRK